MNWQHLFFKITQVFRPAKKKAAGLVVEIFSKPDCQLCEQAKEVLAKMQQRYGFEVREVNITSDPTLLTEYETRIPLIRVDGHLVCKYFVGEAAVAKRLAVAAAGKNPKKK